MRANPREKVAQCSKIGVDGAIHRTAILLVTFQFLKRTDHRAHGGHSEQCRRQSQNSPHDILSQDDCQTFGRMEVDCKLVGSSQMRIPLYFDSRFDAFMMDAAFPPPPPPPPPLSPSPPFLSFPPSSPPPSPPRPPPRVLRPAAGSLFLMIIMVFHNV